MNFNLADIFYPEGVPAELHLTSRSSEFGYWLRLSYKGMAVKDDRLKLVWWLVIGGWVIACGTFCLADRFVVPFLEAVCDGVDELNKQLQRTGDKWVKSGGEQFALTSFSHVSSFAEVCDAVSRGYDTMIRSPNPCGDNRFPPPG